MTDEIDLDREMRRVGERHRQRYAEASIKGAFARRVERSPVLPPVPEPPFYPTEVSVLCGKGWFECEAPTFGAVPWHVRAGWPKGVDLPVVVVK